MTVRKNITLSDSVAEALGKKLQAEPWRKGNFSALTDELLYKVLNEMGLLPKGDAEKQKD